MRTYVTAPDAPYVEDFQRIDAQFRRLQTAATSPGPLPPLVWAEQTMQIGRLAKEMSDLGWKAGRSRLLCCFARHDRQARHTFSLEGGFGRCRSFTERSSSSTNFLSG